MVEKFGPLDVRPAPARSALPSPMVISDALWDVQHPMNGKRYTSKRGFSRATRVLGGLELGNDAPTRPRDNRTRISKDDVRRAHQKVLQGYKPAPLETSVLPPE